MFNRFHIVRQHLHNGDETLFQCFLKAYSILFRVLPRLCAFTDGQSQVVGDETLFCLKRTYCIEYSKNKRQMYK